MIALFVYIEGCVVWFHVWFVFSCLKVHCYVEEVYCLKVDLYCDLQSVGFEYFADFCFSFLCLSWWLFAGCESVVSVESYVDVYVL